MYVYTNIYLYVSISICLCMYTGHSVQGSEVVGFLREQGCPTFMIPTLIKQLPQVLVEVVVVVVVLVIFHQF